VTNSLLQSVDDDAGSHDYSDTAPLSEDRVNRVDDDGVNIYSRLKETLVNNLMDQFSASLSRKKRLPEERNEKVSAVKVLNTLVATPKNSYRSLATRGKEKSNSPRRKKSPVLSQRPPLPDPPAQPAAEKKKSMKKTLQISKPFPIRPVASKAKEKEEKEREERERRDAERKKRLQKRSLSPLRLPRSELKNYETVPYISDNALFDFVFSYYAMHSKPIPYRGISSSVHPFMPWNCNLDSFMSSKCRY
jgi:hypothetical protein